jgi:cobalt-zinc-cadmium efflux system outer membrane protein
LKLAQVTGLVPDVDVHMPFGKDFSFAPPTIAPGTFGTFNFFSFSFAPPIWDWNKGNIIAGQAGVIFAGEQVHLAEMNLANNLAVAYANYRNNLYAIEAYRRSVLPDLVRYYRGIFERRQIDPRSPFNDLVTAQETLSQNVSSYLGVLGALWTSVVSVTDFLQTDDLFQIAKPRALPDLPQFSRLPSLWACDHGTVASPCANAMDVIAMGGVLASAASTRAQPVPGKPRRPSPLGDGRAARASMRPVESPADRQDPTEAVFGMTRPDSYPAPR